MYVKAVNWINFYTVLMKRAYKGSAVLHVHVGHGGGEMEMYALKTRPLQVSLS